MRRADEDEFREFARHHAVPLRRSAYLLCGDWHLAEDIVQTTLIKLYGAWPRVVCRHQAGGQDEVAEAALPPRQRAVLVLRYFESLSISETAAALGCSDGTVKSQAARGLASMRTHLGQANPAALTRENR